MAGGNQLLRLSVFIDYENAMRNARRAFGHSHFTHGHFHPPLVALEIAKRQVKDSGLRTVEAVRVYRGLPDGKQERKAFKAAESQRAAWNKHPRIHTRMRPLRYPPSWPTEPAQEKGIDVHLAVDLTLGAVRDEYDVAVVFSADTDLQPALEAVLDLGKVVEVASWRPPPPAFGQELRLPKGRSEVLWVHRLDRLVYKRCQDLTDYTQPLTVRGPPPWG